jgi:hypothetical protein
MLHMFHAYVASILSKCCVCVAIVFKCFHVFLQICFKCFICLLLYVASIASECFKSRSSVAHGICVGSVTAASGPTRTCGTGPHMSAQNTSTGGPSGVGPRVDARNGGVETVCIRGRPSRRPGTSSVASALVPPQGIGRLLHFAFFS